MQLASRAVPVPGAGAFDASPASARAAAVAAPAPERVLAVASAPALRWAEIPLHPLAAAQARARPRDTAAVAGTGDRREDEERALPSDSGRAVEAHRATARRPAPPAPRALGVRAVLRPGRAPEIRVGGPPSRPYGERTARSTVAPGGSPSTDLNGPDNSFTPSVASSVLDWDVVSADADNWRVDVTALTVTGQLNIHPWTNAPSSMTVPNTPNPVDGGNIENDASSPNDWRAVVADLSDYDTAGGGAGPDWHDTAASRAHETAHWTGDYLGDAVTSAAGGNWAQANRDLDALLEPKSSSAAAAAARTALEPRVSARFASWRHATLARWNHLITSTDQPGAGGRGYAAGKAVLDGDVAAVQAYARSKGWTGAAGGAGTGGRGSGLSRGARVGIGIGVGAGVGAAVGAGIGTVAGPIGALVGAGIGLGVGALIGGLAGAAS